MAASKQQVRLHRPSVGKSEVRCPSVVPLGKKMDNGRDCRNFNFGQDRRCFCQASHPKYYNRPIMFRSENSAQIKQKRRIRHFEQSEFCDCDTAQPEPFEIRLGKIGNF